MPRGSGSLGGRDGQLWAQRSGRRIPVLVHRCFPWSEPGRHFSLRDNEENEFVHIGDMDDLDDESQAALARALADAGFLMEVTAVREVAEEVEIRIWTVETRQGFRRFQTRLDDWPRAVSGGGLLIRDVAGDLYHVPDPAALDRASQKWLWAYAVSRHAATGRLGPLLYRGEVVVTSEAARETPPGPTRRSGTKAGSMKGCQYIARGVLVAALCVLALVPTGVKGLVRTPVSLAQAPTAREGWHYLGGPRVTARYRGTDSLRAARALAVLESAGPLPGLHRKDMHATLTVAPNRGVMDSLVAGRVPEWAAAVAIPRAHGDRGSRGRLVAWFVAGRSSSAAARNGPSGFWPTRWRGFGCLAGSTKGTRNGAAGGWLDDGGWKLGVALAFGSVPDLDSLTLACPASACLPRSPICCRRR